MLKYSGRLGAVLLASKLSISSSVANSSGWTGEVLVSLSVRACKKSAGTALYLVSMVASARVSICRTLRLRSVWVSDSDIKLAIAADKSDRFSQSATADFSSVYVVIAIAQSYLPRPCTEHLVRAVVEPSLESFWVLQDALLLQFMVNAHGDTANLVHLALPVGTPVNIVVCGLVVLNDVGDVLLGLNGHTAVSVLMPKLGDAGILVLGKNSCVDHVKKGAELLAQPLS